MWITQSVTYGAFKFEHALKLSNSLGIHFTDKYEYKFLVQSVVL